MSAELKQLSPTQVWGYFYPLTQIPRHAGQMEAITAHLVHFGGERKLNTVQDRAGNVLIRKPASPGREAHKTVTLQAHLDVFPTNTATPPIAPYQEGDWLTAYPATLGADNGIGVAYLMALLADNTLTHGPLEVLFTIDKEGGMEGAFALQPGLLKGDMLINLDAETEGQFTIGCAGGADLNISFQFKEDHYIPEGDTAVRLTISGLKGGHSGSDIHYGRANANKLLFRFLKEAVRDYGARLATVQGGERRNAIPHQASAIVTIPGDNAEALWELVADYQDTYRNEYLGIEEQIYFDASMAEMPSTLIPAEIQDDLINAIEACQNGVISLTAELTGTVETSTNLAIVQRSAQRIELKARVRSLSESRMYALCSSLESTFALAGAKVEYGPTYPQWEPSPGTTLLPLMQQCYRTLYGTEPTTKRVHTGLECGVFQSNYPEMEMVSIGPELQHTHTPHERLHIASVQRVWDLLVSTLAGV